MNMQVSYDSIMDACAMAGVHFPIFEIDKMLLGEKPMAQTVKTVLINLANEKPINPPKDEPLKVRSSTKNYMERRADILGILDNHHLKASEICLAMDIDASQCRRLLSAMHVDGLLNYVEHHLKYRVWYIKGQPEPQFTDYGIYKKLRAEAKELGLVTYLGKPCEKCGGTEIYTGANKCKPCLTTYRKTYLKDY